MGVVIDAPADARTGPVIGPRGTPERVWRAWPGPRGPDLQARLGQAQRLVVVAPHPDDEVLACGGTLARHAACDGDVLIVAVTDGEASHGEASHALAALRRAERIEGLRRLRLQRLRIEALGLPDGHVAAHADALRAALGALLAPGDLVVTTWRHDAHTDHEACAAACAAACTAAGIGWFEAPVWMWHWAAPGDARVPWPALGRVGLDAASVQRKVHALAAHASQLMPRGPLPAVLDREMAARAARPDERYFAFGPGGG